MTQAEYKAPTVAAFKQWARAHRTMAKDVMAARAFAAAERARVDAYVRPIFESFGFTRMKGEDELPIKNPDHLYLCQDEALCQRFYEACSAAHIAHGWKGNPEHCPALVAKQRQIESETELIKSASSLMNADMTMLYGDEREKLLNLLLGACAL